MKTTPPRTLVQYMNTHVARWKKQFGAVQKVIDSLPDSHDHTAEIEAAEKRSHTDTDNRSQYEEEKKDEEPSWIYQESQIIDDHTVIKEKNVADSS